MTRKIGRNHIEFFHEEDGHSYRSYGSSIFISAMLSEGFLPQERRSDC